MQLTKSITLLLALLTVSSCSFFSKNLEEKSLQEEFPEDSISSETLESQSLSNLESPKDFVNFYLRSKISLYNSNSLNTIAKNNYKLSLESPNNRTIQENALLLSLAARNYADTINILNNKQVSEKLAFEDLIHFSTALAQDDIKKSEKALQELMADENRLPHLKIVKAYFKYEQHKDITILRDEILAINSSSSLDGFKSYYIARAYEAEGLYKDALDFYSQAFFINTLRTPELFKRLVYVTTKLDTKDKNKIYKSNSKYGKNIYLVDQSFIDIKQIDAIDNSLKSVTSQAVYDLGWSIIQTSSNLAGLDFLAIADYIKPDDKNKIQIALGLHNNKWTSDAVDLLKSINKDSKSYITANIMLADILKTEHPKQAVNIIKKLKTTKRMNNNYLDTILGQIYLTSENYKQAEKYLTKALKDDQSSKLFFSRAVAYERTSQFDKAIADLKVALNKNSNNPIVLNYLGYLLIDLNKDTEYGLELIEKSVKLDPTNPATLDSLGWAYIQLEKYVQGLEVLEQAYAMNSQDGVITGHLGDAYYHNNRKNEAIVYWKKALDLEKNDKREIKRIKNKLYKYNN